MMGVLPSEEVDEFACQRRCLKQPGCSHFSFWKPGRLCHLEDRYAERRELRPGYISGPFQCWSYLLPGEYTKLRNHTYVPQRFRCMQIGITWSPDLASVDLTDLSGDRDEVVFACQERCRNTQGCKHFTLMFPSLCRLAADTATPLPAVSSISGPPTGDCESLMSDAPLAHTFMRKYSADIPPSSPHLHSVALASSAVALTASAAFVAVMVRRKHLTRSASFMDEEEALTASQE